MKACMTSLRSLVIALGLGIFATGCIVQSEADAEPDTMAGAAELEAQAAEEGRAGSGEADDAGANGDDDETGEADEEPTPADPTDPSGLCTSTNCTQV